MKSLSFNILNDRNGAVLRYLQRTSVICILFASNCFFQVSTSFLSYCDACILKFLYKFKKEK